MNPKLNIAVIYSVPTTKARERRFIATEEDTEKSAQEITAALKEKGVNVNLHSLTEKNIGDIKKIKADCIFNVIEWDGLDLDLTIQAIKLLEEMKIPFTGSDSATVMLANDKAMLKSVLKDKHLPTPSWQVFKTGDEPLDPSLRFPVIVKPSLEHCSIGLDREAVVSESQALKSIIQKKLKEFKQPMLAEEFIEGREFQVTVLEKNGSPHVLPIAEINFHSKDEREFLTFESRWDEAHKDYQGSSVILADLKRFLVIAISRIALRTFNELGFRDYCRLDIRLRGSVVYILEANANPGLGDDEDYGMTVSYKAEGMNFADFTLAIVESCLRRFGKSG